MDPKNTLKQTEAFVKHLMKDDYSGHDWQHIVRVRQLALQIQAREGGDSFIVQMIALLHDVDDWKLKHQDAPSRVNELLAKIEAREEIKEKIRENIENISFKGAGKNDPPMDMEGEIVRDADRLDAMGAVGIARAFAFGGCRNREMYEMDMQIAYHQTFKAYKENRSSTIAHFFEKLLLLKNRLHTNTAKGIGEKRHRFMLDFLHRFADETGIQLPEIPDQF